MTTKQLVVVTVLVWVSVALILGVIYWAARWGLASALAPWHVVTAVWL